jgi:hypothetical protein
LVALIYVGGAAIMALRLAFNKLPNATAVASRLAREVLISIGLMWIVGPAVVIFIVYFLWHYTTGAPLAAGEIAVSWRNAVIGGAILTLPGLLWAYFLSDYRGPVLLWSLLAFVISTLVVRTALALRKVLISAPPFDPGRQQFRLSLALGVVWAFTAIPGFVILGAAIKFQPVKVCAANGQIQKSGLFVGETDDRIYLGETEPDAAGDRRLLTIPFDKVDQVFVGAGSVGSICDVTSDSTTPKA